MPAETSVIIAMIQQQNTVDKERHDTVIDRLEGLTERVAQLEQRPYFPGPLHTRLSRMGEQDEEAEKRRDRIDAAEIDHTTYQRLIGRRQAVIGFCTMALGFVGGSVKSHFGL